MRIAKEAWPFVLPTLIVGIGGLVAGLYLPGFYWLSALAVLSVAALLFFFRDPHRSFEGPSDIIIAPADGRVTRVDTVADPEVGDDRYHRIATFLSVFNVHVQKAPTAGQVVHAHYRRGKKIAAFYPDADTVNESHLTVLESDGGAKVGVRQIAGLIARRVVPYLRVEDRIERGGLFGVIKFGSRVDLIVPETHEVLVKPGDRVRAGETPMARPLEAGAARKQQTGHTEESP